MPTAGYVATLKLTGTAVAFVDAATTALGSNAFQVTDATKRVLSPDAAVVVEDGGVALPSTSYTVDYFFGIVRLGSAPAGTVTVSASFLPLLTVAEVRGITLAMTAAELDTSVNGETYTKHILGKRGAEVSFESLSLVGADLDPGAGTESWDAIFNSGAPKLLEVGLGGTAAWRGWVRLPSLGIACPQDGVYSGSISAKSVALPAFGRREVVGFSLRVEG